MKVPDEAPTRMRGEVVVCILADGRVDAVSRCRQSLSAHTPEDVVVITADVVAGGGFAQAVNAVLHSTAPADCLLIDGDAVVGAGWFAAMREAAGGPVVATATALSNVASLAAVPSPGGELPAEWSAELAAQAVQSASLHLRPHLPVASLPCVYICRSAIELVGEFNPAFTNGAAALADFAQRCIERGLRNVAADDVFVMSHRTYPLGKRDAVLLDKLHPTAAVQITDAAEDQRGPLARSLTAATQSLLGTSITLDGSCLGEAIMGTQRHVLELIGALWRRHEFRLRVVLPEAAGEHVHRALGAFPGIELVRWGTDMPVEPSDIVHRPFQLFDTSQYIELRRFGHRVVITQQDLIGYRNPAYFVRPSDWVAYRASNRWALEAADAVLCFSQAVADEVVAEGLAAATRTSVAYIGIDHRVISDYIEARAPAGCSDLKGHEDLLCLGADFRHKNREFALEIAQELVRTHGWRGRLIFAGPHVGEGSSMANETRLLEAHSALRDHLVVLSDVSEAEKRWLLEHCSVVLYPTTVEGFGLIPFETAQADRPCVFASQASLAEVLPAELARIVPWDAPATAANVAALLRDAAAREALVRGILAAGERFRWDATAAQVADIYHQVAAQPPRLEAVPEATQLVRTGTPVAGQGRNPQRSSVGLSGHADAKAAIVALERRRILGGLVLGGMGLAYRWSRHVIRGR